MEVDCGSAFCAPVVHEIIKPRAKVHQSDLQNGDVSTEAGALMVGTKYSSSTALLSLSNPTDLLADSNALMDKTSIAGDGVHTAFKALKKLPAPISPVLLTSEPRLQMLKTLGDLRDESYEELAFDLKAAIKAFEAKPFISPASKLVDVSLDQ
ncbi:hypothetical protein BY996DRAFT_6515425 [Phakopsora pachyrhizi]|nr:hypothetical protein BY996DRAFT_6515425 [Phakopsora pachyrhizi]